MKSTMSSISLYVLLSMLCWQCDSTPATEATAANNGTTAVKTSRSIVALEKPDINITVNGINSGEVRLLGIFADQQFLADKATVNAQGQFRFAREESYDPGAYWVVLPNDQHFQMLISEDQTFNITTDINNIYGAMQVEGSIDNQLLQQTQVYEEGYQARYRALNGASPQQLIEERNGHLNGIFEQHPNSFFTSFKRAGQNPSLRLDKPEDEQVYWYCVDYWSVVDFTDDRLIRTPVIKNKLQRYFKELTNQNPDSIKANTDMLLSLVPAGTEYYKYFANWITIQYEPAKTTLMDAEAVWVHMIQNYFTYDKAFWSDSANTYALQLRAAEMANSLVGQAGPNVQVPDESGQIRALYDLTAPYLVVYMYNPDCEHCQEQTPKLVSLHQQWKSQTSQEVDVYAIAIDTEADKWKNYIAQTGMTWTNVFDPTNKSIYKTYFVNVTPEVYLLGPDRKIIAKNLDVSQIEDAIRLDKAKR